MTTAVELPKTIRRALMVGFNVELSGNAPVEVPITHFNYHAALDDNDKPVADYVGVYHGVIQLRGEHGYFWKALAFEITQNDHDTSAEFLTEEERKGLSYSVRYVELFDLTSVDGRAHVVKMTPVFVFVEKPIADTSAARNNTGELKPEWTLTQYDEAIDGLRTATLVSSTGTLAKLQIDRAHQIVEIMVDDRCLKSLNPKRQLTYTTNDAATLISQIEYSYMAQRYSKALTGKDNPIVAAGKVDLSVIAAPTYVIAAEMASSVAGVPEAALLDCDSSEAVITVDPGHPSGDTTEQSTSGSVD